MVMPVEACNGINKYDKIITLAKVLSIEPIPPSLLKGRINLL
jgi:hypothetical protein